MKRASFLVGLALVLLLAGCDGGDERVYEESGPSASREEVSQMRAISGRWRTRAGVLPGQDRRHVIMDIAGDGSVSMELRESGGKSDIVLEQASGDLSLLPDGFSVEMQETGKELRYFRSFTAKMPSGGVLSLEGEGAGLDMTYVGQ